LSPLKEEKEDIRYQIALLEIEKVGPTVARKLIEAFGSAQAVFKASEEELLALGTLGISINNGVQDKNNLSFADAQIKFAEQQGTHILSYYQPEFPNRLKHCSDAPLILYQKGNQNLNHDRMVAIVGTRRCSDYGRDFCKELIKELNKYGAIVVSGLAFGIDYCAHKNATDQGVANIAVFAHGLDRVYPSEHRSLAGEIIKNGALLTEYAINTRPERENFPQRNRIVAGMVDAVVVVESAIKGGSIITAKLGNDYNRSVFALPGRIGDKASEGCNHLIKTEQAHLLQSAKDVAYIMGWDKSAKKKNAPVIQKQLFLDLNDQESILVEALQGGVRSIDEITITSGLVMSVVSTQLLMLEFKGIIKALPGKKYTLA